MSLGRSGAADPDVAGRLLLLDPLGAAVCQEVELNLAFRWFCRLGLEDAVPDHSTFSVNRHGRFRDSDILRRVFERVVDQCVAAGLVGGEGFAVDASVIEADASRYKRVEGAAIEWTEAERSRRPVRESLAALDSGEAPTNPDRAPKAMSPTDPAAAWTTRGRHKVMFGYSLNYLIDMEHAVIFDVELRRPVCVAVGLIVFGSIVLLIFRGASASLGPAVISPLKNGSP